MSLIDFSKIPGYPEAVNREQANRELAFLPAPLPILGVPIKHLSLRHHILLCGCQNRFFVEGGRIQAADVLGFLWFVSQEYSVKAGAREAFFKKYRRALQSGFGQSVAEINVYIGQVYQDASFGGGGTKQYTAPAASVVDLLAQQYGWADEAILEMPLARIFQYTRRIEMRLNPDKPQFNRTDGLIGKWLQAQQPNG